jgi:cysteine desulfurase
VFAPVYLDHNATTPLAPEVREAMLRWLGEGFGNASSAHSFGRRARAMIDQARQQVAEAVNAHPTEIVFTSGATEANNLILKGFAATQTPSLLAISAIEHPSVSEPARQLVRAGWTLRPLAVDREGRIEPEDYARALGASPRLVSVMSANNETGVLQDIPTLAALARSAGALFHTDAVQALGRVAVDFRASGVSAMSLSSHKIGGPQGAGALILDKRVDLAPLIAGGGQERGLRSGTENLIAIAGFGLACACAVREMDRSKAIVSLREHLEQELHARGAVVFGEGASRLPNTVFFAVEGVAGEALVSRLDRQGFAIASGSACASATPEASATLLAMGVTPELAHCAVRVSLGMENTFDEVARFLQALARSLGELKGLAAHAA